MASILNVGNFSRILTLSTGTFSGMNLGLSLVSVPAIYATNDPLPVWRTFYSRASKLSVFSLLVSTAAGTFCFVKSGAGSENAGFAVSAVLSFCIIPYTIFFIKPINDHLFSLDRNEEAKTVKTIVEKWEKLHWARTIVGALVFGLQVLQIGQSSIDLIR